MNSPQTSEQKHSGFGFFFPLKRLKRPDSTEQHSHSRHADCYSLQKTRVLTLELHKQDPGTSAMLQKLTRLTQPANTLLTITEVSQLVLLQYLASRNKYNTWKKSSPIHIRRGRGDRREDRYSFWKMLQNISTHLLFCSYSCVIFTSLFSSILHFPCPSRLNLCSF